MELDPDALPRRPSGRIQRDAADTLFHTVRGELDADIVSDMLRGEKAQSRSVNFKADELRDFFPRDYSAEQIKNAIFDLLEARQRSRAGRER